ncbi:hypothetical protein NicSoilE8_41480 (plasmid) [Arthrobacter sp. NicSoilE8]|nr:hypothetical protein NicSoilE8_41480 [Arthrobacter sp. NicSoilE8]
MDTFDDFELLSKAELIELLAERTDPGVNIAFPGKAITRQLARKVRPRVQRTIAKHSAGTPTEQAQNLILEGDNLHGLATLYRERGHVDLILTDPPYNTGNDFRYNDKWDSDPNDDGVGNLVGADDKAKHTKWMKFMYPRLQMMHAMLSQTGVLAICIDFRELFHLGQMLDEIFVDKNRLGIINWQRTYSKQNDSGQLATVTEYVLVYAKDAKLAKTALLYKDRDQDPANNPDSDPEPWTDSPATASNAKAHKSMVYAIQNPFTGELLYPPRGSAWRNEQAWIIEQLAGWNVDFELKDIHDAGKRAQLIGVDESKVPDVKAIVVSGSLEEATAKATAVRDSGVWPEFYFLRQGLGKPRIKKHIKKMKKGEVSSTFWSTESLLWETDTSWPHQVSGHSEQGVKELTAVVGEGHEFKTVKPLRLFEKIIKLWCPVDGTVLDPFAGSGTAGHAVLSLNDSTGSDRRFILMEQGRQDKDDSYARTLTAERMRRVISGDWASGPKPAMSGGFAFRQLTKQVDARALLQMEREEMVDTVVASYFDSSRRRGASLVRINDPAYEYLVASNSDGEGFFLVWKGPGENTDLTEEVYEACVEEGLKAGLRAKYHVYGRFNLFSTEGVHFYQIPDRILADFGLDVRTESYEDATT